MTGPIISISLVCNFNTLMIKEEKYELNVNIEFPASKIKQMHEYRNIMVKNSNLILTPCISKLHYQA